MTSMRTKTNLLLGAFALVISSVACDSPSTPTPPPPPPTPPPTQPAPTGATV
jgi:hypothetical protein